MVLRKNKPVIAVTMGDLAGVGPEIVAKSLLSADIQYPATFLIVGDEAVLDATCSKLGIRGRPERWNGTSDLSEMPRGIYMKSLTRLSAGMIRVGKVDRRWGKASMAYVQYAAVLALAHRVDAIVTAPISKEAMHKAGYSFQGHTDFLAHLAGIKTVRMMFLGPRMKVILATVHVPLRKVADLLNAQRVFETIRLGGQTLQTMGVENPRIAVCGLNPHAGEGGAFGTEEHQKIRPAILAALRLGWQVSGPAPADSLFYQAAKDKVDLIVAMYHDQGLIPFKMLHFDCGVNITVGLPFVRTSPDHGTAYDIAGKGIADPRSMKEAIRWAVKLMARKTF